MSDVSQHLNVASCGSDPAIPIHFFTVIILAVSLHRKYPDGITGFDRQYPDTWRTTKLRALPFMAWGYVEDYLAELNRHGIEPGRDVAVGDMMHGEMVACPGIRFVRRRGPYTELGGAI